MSLSISLATAVVSDAVVWLFSADVADRSFIASVVTRRCSTSRAENCRQPSGCGMSEKSSVGICATGAGLGVPLSSFIAFSSRSSSQALARVAGRAMRAGMDMYLHAVGDLRWVNF